MISNTELGAEVRSLGKLNVDDLRAAWSERYGPPPPLRSPDHLRRLLAWRMQAEVHGGLSVETRRLLTRKPDAKPSPRLAPGSKVAREWRGVRYEVEIAQTGVVFEGRSYASLSEVARAITGVRWNGPRFFGLRSPA